MKFNEIELLELSKVPIDNKENNYFSNSVSFRSFNGNKKIYILLAIEFSMLMIYFPFLCLLRKSCNTDDFESPRFMSINLIVAFFIGFILSILHLEQEGSAPSSVKYILRVIDWIFFVILLSMTVVCIILIFFQNETDLSEYYKNLQKNQLIKYPTIGELFNGRRINSILVTIFMSILTVIYLIKAILLTMEANSDNQNTRKTANFKRFNKSVMLINNFNLFKNKI